MFARKKLFLLICIFSLGWAGATLAADGVLEINQTCAVNGGCFDGDMAGFPVTIDGSAGKSYRLTGDLALITDVDAVLITSSYVTLDLGGFEIAGPGSCTGTGVTLDCGGIGTGSAVYTTANPSGITIRNGTVRNMRFHGIRAEGMGHRITEITARHNAVNGIATQDQELVKNCVAIENGINGIEVPTGSVVDGSLAMGNGANGIVISGQGGSVFGSTSRANGGRGFELHSGLSKFGSNNVSLANEIEDNCGGGVCTSMRRYLMSTSFSAGDGVLTLCPSDFHFASMWELINPSALAYDTILGAQDEDSGSGPPGFRPAWVRSGASFNSNNSTRGNCDGWTIFTGGSGATAELRTPIDAQGQPAWEMDDVGCDIVLSAWCIEDL